jgi:hypothetical protein
MFREDEVAAENLKVLAKQNGRHLSDEVRAATAVYLDLINLAHLRLTEPVPGREDELADVERRIRDDIGRVLLPALHPDVRSKFENDRAVEYPVARFGSIKVPFDGLIEWIVGRRRNERSRS